MSREGRTGLESGMEEVDGCEEECLQGGPVVAAPVGSDGGSFSLKECRAVFCDGVVRALEGWCPHLQHLSHWRQNERWGRRRGRGTKTGWRTPAAAAAAVAAVVAAAAASGLSEEEAHPPGSERRWQVGKIRACHLLFVELIPCLKKIWGVLHSNFCFNK